MSVETSISNNVAEIILDCPPVNALTSTEWLDLAINIDNLAHNNDVRVILISARGKGFCAGADIKDMHGKSFVEMADSDFFRPATDSIESLKKPIIAAVSGYALGGGCELAMMCDFIICSETAQFGQPEVNLGVMAGIGGTQRLTRFVGKSKSMEMHLTGRFMNAEEAERSGLVSRVVPVNELRDEVFNVALKIAEKSTLSVQFIKESVKRSYETPLSEGLRFERKSFHSLFATDDKKEGMTAFIEKRKPHFRNQ